MNQEQHSLDMKLFKATIFFGHSPTISDTVEANTAQAATMAVSTEHPSAMSITIEEIS